MVAKKRQSPTASRRTTSRKASKKHTNGSKKYGVIAVVGIIILASVVGVYAALQQQQPAEALAKGCASGYGASVVPKDADWNVDTSLAITQNLSEPTYDATTRSCSWQATVVVTSKQGAERKSCTIHAGDQRIACPEAGQTSVVFSGARTGDPNRAPYLPSKLYVEEVLNDGATYISPTLNY